MKMLSAALNAYRVTTPRAMNTLTRGRLFPLSVCIVYLRCERPRQQQQQTSVHGLEIVLCIFFCFVFVFINKILYASVAECKLSIGKCSMFMMGARWQWYCMHHSTILHYYCWLLAVILPSFSQFSLRIASSVYSMWHCYCGNECAGEHATIETVAVCKCTCNAAQNVIGGNLWHWHSYPSVTCGGGGGGAMCACHRSTIHMQLHVFSRTGLPARYTTRMDGRTVWTGNLCGSRCVFYCAHQMHRKSLLFRLLLQHTHYIPCTFAAYDI